MKDAGPLGQGRKDPDKVIAQRVANLAKRGNLGKAAQAALSPHKA